MPTINYRDLNRKVMLEGVNAVTNELEADLTANRLSPSDFSIRDLFENLVVDANGESCGYHVMRECFDPRGPHKMMMESVPSATSLSSFTHITGQIFFNAMLSQYSAESLSISKAVRTVPTRLSGERLPGIGGLGDVSEVVAEGNPYPTVGLNEDWIDTPQTAKHGAIVPVTKEAIFFDRTNMLLEKAGEIGFYIGLNKELRIIDAILDSRATANLTAHRYYWRGTSYGTYQTSTPWINVKASNGLTDWININNAIQVGNQILDPNTNQPIQIDYNTIFCAEQTRAVANRIINATEVRFQPGSTTATATIGNTPIPVGQYNVLSNRYVYQRIGGSGVATDWFLGDFKRAVAYMENWPLQTLQAPPNSELEFTNDIVFRYKGSERGAAAVLEPRAIILNTVA